MKNRRTEVGLLLLISATTWAQKSSSPIETLPQFGNNGSVVRYSGREWKIIKQMKVAFDASVGLSNVVLLESSESTGEGGAGQPLNDVELLIVQGGKVIYDFAREAAGLPQSTRFYMGDYLGTRDLKHDGVPQILFHSGYQAASNSLTLEHILLYDKSKASFTDVAPETFYDSGTHGLVWMTLGGRTVVVIADRNWSPSTPLEKRCHYCPSPFKYDAYQWHRRTGPFVLYRRLYGKESYSDSDKALNGDWEFIQSALK